MDDSDGGGLYPSGGFDFFNTKSSGRAVYLRFILDEEHISEDQQDY